MKKLTLEEKVEIRGDLIECAKVYKNANPENQKVIDVWINKYLLERVLYGTGNYVLYCGYMKLYRGFKEKQ